MILLNTYLLTYPKKIHRYLKPRSKMTSLLPNLVSYPNRKKGVGDALLKERS